MIFVCFALLAISAVLIIVTIITSSVGIGVAALVCAVAGTGLLLAVFAAYRQQQLQAGGRTDLATTPAPQAAAPVVTAVGQPAAPVAEARSLDRPPVPHYADLTAAKAAALVSTLNLEELHAMRRYEVEHAGRKQVLAAVDRRIEEVVAIRKQLV